MKSSKQKLFFCMSILFLCFQNCGQKVSFQATQASTIDEASELEQPLEVPFDETCSTNQEKYNGVCVAKCNSNQYRNSGGQCIANPVTCNANQDYWNGTCVATCELNQSRDLTTGICKTNPTICNTNQDKWNDLCVAKCGSNQYRNSQGQCVASPVVCNFNQENINGNCVAKCESYQQRVNNVCSNISFTENCSDSGIAEGTRSCQYTNSQMQKSCGSCSPSKCGVGYEFISSPNYSCQPINYGSCEIPVGDYEWSESSTIYSCKQNVPAKITLAVGQEYNLDSIKPGVAFGSIKFKCKEVQTQSVANNGGLPYMFKRLHHVTPHGDAYAVFNTNPTFQSSWTGSCKRDVNCLSGSGMSTSAYGGIQIGFLFSKSQFSGSAIKKCVRNQNNETYEVHLRCNGNSSPLQSHGDWELIDGIKADCQETDATGSNKVSVYRFPGSDQQVKSGIGPSCRAYYCSKDSTSRSVLVSGANFNVLSGDNGCYTLDTSDSVTVSFATGSPEARNYRCSGGQMIVVDIP